MKLSKQLQNLIRRLSSTREGVWGLGWQVANLIEQKLPINLVKGALNVYDDQVRQFFSPDLERKLNINPVDVYLSEKIEKNGQYEEYSITIQFKLNDEEIVPEKEVENLIREITNLVTMEGLTYRQDIRPQWRSDYDYEFYAYKWLPTGTMALIGD